MSALAPGLRARIDARRAEAYFAGHFPGGPILPGVAQLHLVVERLGEIAGAPLAVRGVPALRLRRIVRPGEDLELTLLDVGPDANLRFELRAESEIAAHGVLALGAPGPAAAAPAINESRTLEAPSVARLLPHQPPARLVEQIVGERPGGLTVATLIPPDNPFAAHGAAPALLGLEFGAQAAAAFEAFSRWRSAGEDAPRIGYFVGARGVTLTSRVIPVGVINRTRVQLAGSAPPLSVYDVAVIAHGVVVLRGSISTFLTTPTDA